MSTITEVTKQKRSKKEELKKDLILLSRPIQMQVTLQNSEINYDQPLGQIIRQAREMQGVTRKKLSELSDISEDQILNIESGRTKQPYLDTIIRLTKALNLDSKRLISKGKEINYDLPIGQIIKQAREIQGITCEKLSEISEISKSQTYSIESGKTKKPKLDTIIKLIQVQKIDSKRVISKYNEINYDLPVGQIIRQAREMQGLTCKKLSEISEVSTAQIYSIESGKTKKPNLDTIIRLTQALNLDVEKLTSKCNEINYDLQVGQIIRQARSYV